MLIVSPEFSCSNEILTIVAMLSGTSKRLILYFQVRILKVMIVPNVWVRPNNQRKEADAAKNLMTIPDGDHLTLMNVYNNYQQSELSLPPSLLLTSTSTLTLTHLTHTTDRHDKNWAYMNYLSGRALQQAENVRAQLERTMERYEIELISTSDERKLFAGIRKSLVCGFFMQVAHREGEKNGYITVKDNQVRGVVCLKVENVC